MIKNTIKILLRAFCLTVTCFIFFTGCKKESESQASQNFSKSSEKVTVKIEKVTPQSIERKVLYTGTIEALVEVKVYPTVSDQIMSLFIEEGDAVKRGKLIAVIRSQLLGENVKQALGSRDAIKANIAGLEDQITRQEKLYKSGVINKAQVDATKYQLDATQAQLNQLEAMVAQAKIRRGDSLVKAPIDGIIGQVVLRPGDMAVPSLPICTIVQIDEVEVYLNIPERELQWFKVGNTIKVRTTSIPDQEFDGTINLISPIIDRLSRTAVVKIRISNPQHLLRPGMMAEVNIIAERKENVVVAPLYAFRLEQFLGVGSEKRVGFVLKGNKVEERQIELGIIVEENAEVTKGINPGEELIIEGQHLLTDGQEVVVERQ